MQSLAPTRRGDRPQHIDGRWVNMLNRDSLDLSAFHAWHEMPAEGETTWYLIGGILFFVSPHDLSCGWSYCTCSCPVLGSRYTYTLTGTISRKRSFVSRCKAPREAAETFKPAACAAVSPEDRYEIHPRILRNPYRPTYFESAEPHDPPGCPRARCYSLPRDAGTLA